MALLSAGCSGTAQKSPSGNIRAEVFAGKEGLYYTVTHDGRTVIDTSAMGVTVDGTELFRDAALRPAGTRKIDETYSVTGRKAVSEGRCNEYLFDVTHRPSGYKYRLQTRLYDDGFAYRFVLPGDGTRTVNGEAAQWRPPHQSRVWFAERNSGWKLLTYAGEWISTTADSLHIVSRQGPVQTMPLLYRTPDEYVMIAEAALYDYSGMRLRAEPGASLRADFTEQEGFELSGDIVTPWRVTIIARDLDALVNTDIITSLNPAPDPELFADTSWIVPGRSLWSWWSGIDGGFMTLEGEKRVIDTAASLGIEYSTVDDGWEERPDKWKFLHELAGYAQSRGVGLFVWRHWEKLNDPADDYRQMRGFLDSVAAIGIKGVKVDFMNGEGIRQIDFNTHLLKNAARRRLLVNLHGCQKPTGEIRTYPNEITREGVRGIELNRITANYEKRMRDEGRTPDPLRPRRRKPEHSGQPQCGPALHARRTGRRGLHSGRVHHARRHDGRPPAGVRAAARLTATDDRRKSVRPLRRRALPPGARHYPPPADGMGRNGRTAAKRNRAAGRHRPPQGRHVVHSRCEHRSRRGDDSRRIDPRDGPKGADRPRRGGRFAADGRSRTAGAGPPRHAVAGERGIYRRARIIFREAGIFYFL